MTDKIDERLNMALQLSADWTGNPDARDITKDIMDKEPPGLDVVMECCGDQSALDQAITLLKPGGMLLIVGIPESRRISFDIHALRRKEICVQNVRRQNNCIREAITIFEKQGHELKRLITHCFSMGDVKMAFDLVKGYKDGVIKAVIRL